MQLVLVSENYEFHIPATIEITFKLIRILVTFQYLNINWVLSKIQPSLNLKTLFLSRKEQFQVKLEQ